MLKVTVIVSAYNVEPYIEKCLRSILAQTLEEIQIVVIDDGSTDSTAGKISEINDARVELYKKENGGLSAARNFGLQFAKGKYILFVDGDDFIEPEMCAVLYETAKKNDADVVECEYFKDYGKRVVAKRHENPPCALIKFCTSFMWNKLIRTELLLDSGIKFKEGIWYEDFNFNLKFASVVKNYVHIDRPLYHYVQRESSIMHTVNERVFDLYASTEDVIAFYKTKNFYEEFRQDIEYLLVSNLLFSMMPVLIMRYDKQNKTNFLKKNYEYCSAIFPNWRKNKYMKEKTLTNLCLRCVNRFSYRLIVFLLGKTKALNGKTGDAK